MLILSTAESLLMTSLRQVEEGDWWYRVVHPNGAHFVKIPSLLPKAPRHVNAVPQNTIVHGCRRFVV